VKHKKKTLSLVISFLTILFYGCTQTTNSTHHITTNQDPPHSFKNKNGCRQRTGERMIISGTIYLPDGKTPAKGAILSVWQTDAKGYYIERAAEQVNHIRAYGKNDDRC
jgi:protocatechuate 3,4-dioxygenase beta subunit